MSHGANNDPDAPGTTVVETGAGFAVVSLLGDHDLLTTDQLSATLQLLLPGCALLVVDLSETRFIDSSAIGVLVKTKIEAEALGVRFRLQLGPDGVARRALEINSLLDSFDYTTSREEALDRHLE
jgi:anti-sigma B factor antagonist